MFTCLLPPYWKQCLLTLFIVLLLPSRSNAYIVVSCCGPVCILIGVFPTLFLVFSQISMPLSCPEGQFNSMTWVPPTLMPTHAAHNLQVVGQFHACMCMKLMTFFYDNRPAIQCTLCNHKGLSCTHTCDNQKSRLCRSKSCACGCLHGLLTNIPAHGWVVQC